MPFPILRTPFVVLSEIINLLEPNEIVTASFCSKNLKRLLKRHYQQRKPLEWRLSIVAHGFWGRVDIGKLSDEYKKKPVLSAKHVFEIRHKSEHKLIQMNGYKREFSSEYPALYFQDRAKGLKMIVEYATDLFNLDVYALLIDGVRIWAIDWINNRQKTMLVHFELKKNICSLDGDEEMDCALRNARASDFYIFNEIVSVNFRFNGKLGPADHLLILSYGHWVTLDNLMNFDFIIIIIVGSRLSVSDLNSFLRHWRAGGSPRLTYLRLHLKTDTILENFDEDLEVVETDEVFKCRFKNGQEFDINGGYRIQRIDGEMATIHFEDGCFELVVSISDIVL
ncbi:hypothetical protein B9Z55_020091 [Caenorhabditis nigoni]|uniref:F-box domain-containing protein n=2 Tax=Caenorhabditis nigoni TaxID=1611254 RepID=A0A2G5TLZ6_9PELO|nr:hypothetical protein B9Z55_020091 [Caenorhabditis nigoni]